MIASDECECDCSSYQIPDEKLSPCEVAYADVRDHRRQDNEARLEENRRKDYPEHHGRLFHRCVNRADDGESISKAQHEVDHCKSREAEEMERLKWLASHEIDSCEPQPCRHANDQPEASAFPHGAVSSRRVTNRRRSRGNYMNAFHDNMINEHA